MAARARVEVGQPVGILDAPQVVRSVEHMQFGAAVRIGLAESDASLRAGRCRSGQPGEGGQRTSEVRHFGFQG